VKALQETAIKTADEEIASLQAKLAGAEASQGEAIKADIAKQETAKATAQDTIAKLGDSTKSIMGLEAPLFGLKNPGLISIPIGFLCVIFGSLLFRDRRAAAMWDELYVRQNTGIHAETAIAH
jgi:cation/acetate symporter